MTYKIKLLNSIAIFSFLFISCEDPSTKKEPFPIADINFDYLQGSNKLFVSAQVNSAYMNSSLDSVEVLWKGVDQQNKNDTLKLYDDGTMGDILSSDNIFSRRIPNSSLIISNVIPSQAKDSIFLSILSFYKNRSIESDVSPFILGNIHPKIGNFNLRDSVTRPAKNNDPNRKLKYTLEIIKVNKKLIKDGCDILDIGGESTRPNSDTVDDIIELPDQKKEKTITEEEKNNIFHKS